MKILNDYEGSSIKIIKNNLELNEVELSLKKENESYSHYYNFMVENEKEQDGIIYIKEIKSSAYYSKKSISVPYIRRLGEEWQRLNKEYFWIEDGVLKIKIQPTEKIEISLVPRYTKANLNEFIGEIKSKKEIKIANDILTKIELGEESNPTVMVIGRQHPGETLSSFFIEGMIKAILENNQIIKKYHFVFYPIVNTIGVEKGNHRYINGLDYNRSWNSKEQPKEIEYLKQQMELYKIECFIDVHNDEITNKDYMRMNKAIDKQEIANIQVLKRISFIRRFARAFIKERKIIDVKAKSAREYVEKKYKCRSILIELSMNNDYKKVKEKGSNFILELFGGKNEK